MNHSKKQSINKKETTIHTFDNMALDYYNKFINYETYTQTYEQLVTFLKTKNTAKVLEIGCGPGNIASYLLKKNPDLDWLGIDLAPQMIDLAKRNHPGAKFEVMDSRDILNLEQKFDLIICGFVTPYLSSDETSQLIQDMHQILNKNSMVYLSTMENPGVLSEFQTTRDGNRVFVYYHDYERLEKYFLNSGFEIIKLERKRFERREQTALTDLFIYARNR